MMIASFDDFCLVMYCLIDDAWKTMADHFHRPGPEPSSCSDSELLTLALVGECCGWAMETDLLSRWREHNDLFPRLPSLSRFNRRRRGLAQAFDLLRADVLAHLDLALDRYCVIDSLPIAAVAFHHAPRAASEWVMHGASFGKVSAKQQTIFGYKLHVLMTLSGVLLDATLVPAHILDLSAGRALLDDYSDRIVLGDKAYVSAPVAEELQQTRALTLLTWPRRNQRAQWPDEYRKPFQDARRMIETVNSQLTEQFKLERNYAHSFWGLCSRIGTKLTAHVLCVYLNRLLGNPDWLHIKQLAFPN